MEDRRSFVTQIVDRYAQETDNGKSPILGELVEFILNQVLEPDDRWDEYQRNPDWFDLPVIEHMLYSCIQRVELEKPLTVLASDELESIVLPNFITVIKGRWHCPVPFILC